MAAFAKNLAGKVAGMASGVLGSFEPVTHRVMGWSPAPPPHPPPWCVRWECEEHAANSAPAGMARSPQVQNFVENAKKELPPPPVSHLSPTPSPERPLERPSPPRAHCARKGAHAAVGPPRPGRNGRHSTCPHMRVARPVSQAPPPPLLCGVGTHGGPPDSLRGANPPRQVDQFGRILKEGLPVLQKEIVSIPGGTVREAVAKGVVAFEVGCWFLVGEAIGRRSFFGYKFD